MTVLMPASNKNKRKYVRPLDGSYRKDQIVYLVYKQESHKIMSDGPYEDFNEANLWMRDLLSKGVCAWMVSYNA